jgi:CDGSH-type Zn-finger protein
MAKTEMDGVTQSARPSSVSTVVTQTHAGLENLIEIILDVSWSRWGRSGRARRVTKSLSVCPGEIKSRSGRPLQVFQLRKGTSRIRRLCDQTPLNMSEPIVFQKFPVVQQAQPGTYWWCSCGASKKQPFCDGTHKGTAFGPVEVKVAETRTVAWCACKHSKAGAFCDGSHKGL